MNDDKKNKSRVAGFVMGVVAVILTLSVSVCILVFLTNGVIEIDIDSATLTSYFDRITVSTIIEQIRSDDEDEIEPTPLQSKISFFGDSITTYTGDTTFNNFFPAGDVTDVSQTWWKIVASQSGCAYGGNSSSSGSTVIDSGQFSGQSQERVDALPEDTTLLYVFMGMNDYWNEVPTSDFKTAYINMLQKIQTRCSSATVRCMTLYKTSFDTNNRLSNYNTAIKEAADSAGCDVIDLEVLNMEDDTMTQEADVHVHPTAKGMQAIAGIVMGTYTPPAPTPTPTPPIPGIPDEEEEPEPPTIINPSGWYADIAYSSGTGSVVGTLDSSGGVKIYDGLPWAPTANTYIYYQYKAKDDIYDLYSKAGISRGTGSSKVVNSSVSGYATTATLEGVTSLAVGVTPAMLDRTYYPNMCNVSNAASGDSSVTRYNLRLACVVVPSGASKSDPSNYLYIPCTKVDAKGHTWYGGVVQTNVKVTSDHTLHIATNNSGSAYQEYTISDSKGVTSLLTEVNAIMNSAGKDMGAWAKNDIETYNLNSATVTALSKYDVVGWVVYK